ncbi:nitrate- and nitrite sensing domain-containing protein [Methylomonas rosea]|uniref:Nitrate- and nitrite sensing domain-containing protein n=1 Tax=Methylomonas rosea TaxID=2952227 RepID=A0ABT1TQ06_9GAMM|nr:nitrate- and nitrite sensing domain-containing protein [Methylomonas sp. WSC-7]MCQ8116869.1 nitrate- and nitrite sensing domain-containing protein [Methylomonas sp. WSC-7]
MPDFVSLLLFLVALFACATAYLLYKKRQTRLNHLLGQLHSLEITGGLKKLLTQIQQHRGMASAYLNGDLSFKYKIAALQSDIDRQFDQLSGQFKRLPESLQSCADIRDVWKQLHPCVLHLSKEDSFERHCLLIGAVLNLIRDTAEHSQLHRESICPYSFIEILWHLLPDTAEAIGQARAIGTGVAAAGRCRITDRIKLGFLITRIRQAVERVEAGMGNAKIAMVADNGFQQASAAVHVHIAHLISHIEQKLLTADKPAIDPAAFFETATGTLNSVFSLYDQGEVITNHTLQNQLSSARRNSKQSFAMMLASLVFLAASLVLKHGVS